MQRLHQIKPHLGIIQPPKKDAQLISDLGNPAAWLLDIFSGTRTLSGVNTSHPRAMELDSYFAAIRNIAEDIAKLPFNIFEIVENGKKLTTSHPAQSLIHNYANDDMSTMDLMETLIHWAISYGNGYAEIVRNGKGEAVQMFPINPSRVKPIFINDKLFYEVHSQNTIEGQELSRFDLLSAEDVFNLRGLGADGIVGYSLFALCSESVGMGLAIQDFASVYFRNGTALSGVLSTEGSLDKKAYENMRESWAKVHEGSSKNKHRIAILEGGTKFEPTSSTAAEAQLLESQKFTVERMARLLRIPPHKIGHAGGLVKANLEAESISYFRDTLMPWIKRISLETDRKIIRSQSFTATYQVDALTLGDSKTRAGVFKTHRNMGTMSINDVRRLEDQNVIEETWADEYHMQSNITTVQNISEGANLKPKANGQTGAPKMDDGEKDEEGRDPEATAIQPEIDILDVFKTAKEAHMPNFKYAARRIIAKELKFLNKKLKSFRNDAQGFEIHVRTFFNEQKADIVDVFDPCCRVFINTFSALNLEFHMDFLREFADKYAEDGINESIFTWNKQQKGEVMDKNIEELEEKMAGLVINLIGNNAKGFKNEDE